MRLHHIGVVVRSIEQQINYYRQFNWTLVTPKIHDPLQDVFVAFLEISGSNTLLELIEPASADSPVANALQRGGGLNHLCYIVPELRQAVAEMVENGAILVRPPTPAVAFNGRHIAFLYTRSRELVEFVEEES